MNIKISYSAVLHIEGLTNGSILETRDGTSISGLLALFNVKEEHQRTITALVNGRQRGLSHILEDNDDLNLLLPIGGG
ncbi:MAG TPA: hypothetical protein VMX75_10885 [Spirochaetia bacterium]|nr:hypothetical protein [Spirochaetia bacterium]